MIAGRLGAGGSRSAATWCRRLKIRAAILTLAFEPAFVAITLDTYSHVIPELGDAAAEAVDDMLGD
jgi:hypothetical protein